MTRRTALHAIRGLLGVTLFTLCLFGVVLALLGAWCAWMEPVVLEGKGAGTERNVLEYAAEGLWTGAFFGGIIGMFAGVGVAIKRLWSRE
jgi:hypothetical protein